MTPQQGMRPGALRWLKFNTVGAGGIVVQLAALTILKSGLRMDYLAATALAVEGAIIHNYCWHERFTWLDRPTDRSWLRFLRFNLSTGLFSIAGNVLLMRCFVTTLHMNYLCANMCTIATCSLLNFLISDWFVFQQE